MMKRVQTSRKWFGKRGIKVGLSAILTAALLIQPITISGTPLASAAQTTEATKLSKINEQPITAGATLQQYVWTSTRNKEKVRANVNVVRIDLHNPHVTLDVMNGLNGQFTTRNTTLGMAKETEAVAAVNGDYYAVAAEGAPIGPQVTSGTLLSSPTLLKGMYAFGLTKQNEPIIDQFSFKGTITAENGATYPLAGLNKTYYWTEDKQHSHTNNIYMYTDAWASSKRADDGATTPTEVLVRNGVVEQIVEKQYLPMNPPSDGYILRAAHKGADYIKQNLKVGDKLSVQYQLQALNTGKTYQADALKSMIGGHTILVNEGKPASYSRDVSSLGGYRARTGLGFSKDQRHVFLITVDANGNSKGMSLSELRDCMVELGVWKGLNLDGGGSTQMVSRPLGEFELELANKPENNFQRKVVNGLGVYSLAPEGSISGLLLDIEQLLFIGETAAIDIKGYDQYYNPVVMNDAGFKWTISRPLGQFGDHTFKPHAAGEATITAASGTAKKSMDVYVAGRNDIKQLRIETDLNSLSAGSTYTLPVVAETVNGLTRRVPSESIAWELRGIEGSVEGNELKVDRVTGDDAAYLIARYDQFSTVKTLPIGIDKLWTDFNDFKHPVSFTSYPSEVMGGARVVYGLPGIDENNRVLYLEYNFRKGTGTKAAYAEFNGDQGVTIEGDPQQMKLKALGDGSLNWLRAEVVDAKGKLHRVDITQAINWYGWKDFTVNFEDYNMAYPITLKKLYIANPEQGQDEREVTGAVGFDDIRFEYRGQTPTFEKKTVKLTIDHNSMIVDNETKQLDQAPVIVNGHTLVPIKFIVEALGGEVGWDAKHKKVTVLRGDQLLDMWIDDKVMVISGGRIDSPVAPTIMSGRTMVPLRLISEQLGWKVTYIPSDQTIIME